MKLSKKSLTISLAYFDKTVISGTLWFSDLKGRPINSIVINDGEGNFVPSTLTNVDFFVNGALQETIDKKFITFNQEGKLVFGKRPLPGFSVSNVAGFCGKKKLLFNGISEFQLCADHQVGFETTCPDPKKISIIFARDF